MKTAWLREEVLFMIVAEVTSHGSGTGLHTPVSVTGVGTRFRVATVPPGQRGENPDGFRKNPGEFAAPLVLGIAAANAAGISCLHLPKVQICSVQVCA